MAKKENAFGGKEPLRWVKHETDSPKDAETPPEELTLPGDKPEETLVVRLAEFDELKEPTEPSVQPDVAPPEAPTLSDLEKSFGEAMLASREQISALSERVDKIAAVLKVLDDKSNNNQYHLDSIIEEQMKAAEVQRDFAGTVQGNLSSHHAETTAAIDKIAKTTNEILPEMAHELTRQNNGSLNSIASGLAAQTDQIRAAVKKVAYWASGIAIATIVAGCLGLWLVESMYGTRVANVVGAKSSMEQRESREPQPPAGAEREEAAPGQQLGEEEKPNEKPATPEKQAAPSTPSQPATPPAGGIKKRFQ